MEKHNWQKADNDGQTMKCTKCFCLVHMMYPGWDTFLSSECDNFPIYKSNIVQDNEEVGAS